MVNGKGSLSREEIKKLYKRIKRGDKEARTILIESNYRLVVHIANQYRNKGVDIDDLIGSGCIGLIKGIDNYDASRGTSLSTYVGKCILNEIIQTLRRKYKNNKEEISLNGYTDNNKGQLENIIGFMPDQSYCLFLSEVRKSFVKDLIARLSPREQQVILMKYGFIDNKLMSDTIISKEIGCCRSNVSHIHTKILTKLRRWTNESELRDYIN